MHPLPRRRTLAALAALAAAASALAVSTSAWSSAQPATTPSHPRLLVVVVVDQMRADYLTRLDGRFTAGFRRLLDEGAVFEQAYYPYLNTVTCAGHATIGTGTLPRTHGAILNQWFDRDTRLRTCTDDPAVTSYAYGDATPGRGHSAAALRVPTLGDRLREQTPESRVVTFSMKARSAIMLAGKGATAVTWLGPRGWQSSTAFGPARPELAKYIAAHPITADEPETWDRVLALDTYTGADAGLGERPEFGWTRLFPHPLGGGTPARFHDRWEESPFSDAYLGRMAEAALRDFRLGQRDVVDFLGVSFSATDLVGHSFGPDSHEVQDTLIRLDRTLGALLTSLDAAVGPGGYALALSADHGVARIPEASRAADDAGGRVPLASVRAAVEKALAPLGPGPHVARVEYTQIYLTPATQAKATAATLAPAIAAVKALPGVSAVVWHGAIDDASSGVPASLREAIRNSYDPERSGDLSIVPAQHWILVPGASPEGGDGTTHGTPHAYDQHVPLIFLGRQFPAGRYQVRVSPADIAPTLAHTAGVPMPGVDGRVVPVAAPAPQ